MWPFSGLIEAKVLGIVYETKQNPTKTASTKEPYQDSDCVRTTTETAAAFEQLPAGHTAGQRLAKGKKTRLTLRFGKTLT